jgi:hypothetical protein
LQAKKHRTEKLVDAIIRERQFSEALIAVLQCWNAAARSNFFTLKVAHASASLTDHSASLLLPRSRIRPHLHPPANLVSVHPPCTSTATTGSPSNSCTRRAASVSRTMPSRNSTTRKRPRSSRTASPISPG